MHYISYLCNNTSICYDLVTTAQNYQNTGILYCVDQKSITMANEQEVIQGIINYLADPMDQRTNAQVAEALGISESSFYSYQNKFRKTIDDRVGALLPTFQAKMRQAGYKALGARLKKSDNAIKLLFQLLGDLDETTKVNITYNTPEEKRKAIQDKLKRLGLTFSEFHGSVKEIVKNKNLDNSIENAEIINKTEQNDKN